MPSGHKIALRAIRAGEAVIKYGSPIGLATAEIPAGAHVHTHNLASTRGRGDLEAPPPRLAEPRLAEPPRRASEIGVAKTHDRTPRVPRAIAGPTAASARATTCWSCRR